MTYGNVTNKAVDLFTRLMLNLVAMALLASVEVQRGFIAASPCTPLPHH